MFQKNIKKIFCKKILKNQKSFEKTLKKSKKQFFKRKKKIL